MDRQKVVKKLKTISSFPWLFRKVRRHIPAILVTVLCSGGSAWLEVEFALMSKAVIDSAVARDSAALKANAVTLALIVFGIIACGLVSGWIRETLGNRLDRSLKSEYITYIMNGDYAVASSYPSGDLLNRLTGDISNICGGITSSLQSFVSLVTALVATIAALSDLSRYIMAVLLAAAVIMGLGMRVLYRYFMKMYAEVRKTEGAVLGFFGEVISKLLIVQGLDISGIMEKRSDEVLEKRWQAQLRQIKFSIGFETGISGMSQIMGLVSLVWCAGKLLAGEITFGGLTAITQLAAKLEMPFFVIPSLARQLFSVFGSAERLREIEAIPQDVPEAGDEPDIAELYKKMSSLSGENITFSYNENNVLENYSFSIPKNMITVICGTSGIGKSTLLKLMLGIYRPDGGTLTIDTDDGKIPLRRSMRKLFTYAPQGNLLISGTLRENLTLVRPDATDEEIAEAVHISAMDEYIGTLPAGLETMLGENGTGISEGQAQRLSLARAFLTGSPVMLLDEITSSLDEETEKKIIERIKGIKGRTCVVVTHRASVRAMADQVIAVE